MYVVCLKKDAQYQQGEYVFTSKKECSEFIDRLNDAQLDNITEIQKYNKASWRNAYYDFFSRPGYLY